MRSATHVTSPSATLNLQRLHDLATRGDHEAIDTLTHHAQQTNDAALLLRCARWLIDRGEPVAIRCGERVFELHSDATSDDVLALKKLDALLSALSHDVPELLRPVQTPLRWSDRAARLVACDLLKKARWRWAPEIPEMTARERAALAAANHAAACARDHAWGTATTAALTRAQATQRRCYQDLLDDSVERYRQQLVDYHEHVSEDHDIDALARHDIAQFAATFHWDWAGSQSVALEDPHEALLETFHALTSGYRELAKPQDLFAFLLPHFLNERDNESAIVNAERALNDHLA